MIPLGLAFASIFLGVTAPIWFGLARPVRRLRKGAEWLDPKPVSPPAAEPITVQTLREYQRCGDKVVVAHHLADWSRDLQRKIFQTLAVNGAITFVVVVVYVVKQDARLQAPTATWTDLGAALAASWPISITMAIALVEIGLFFKLVSDQAAKYRRAIEDARPPKKSMLAWLPNPFRRVEPLQAAAAPSASGTPPA
ncbi:MAG TPA: hypothetical protein VEX16_03775 [Methyloceanibacter sp.]|nr:hypothetical protein [Methyloceanibacter sp.]